MKSRRPHNIRSPYAYEKSQRAKQRKHQTHVAKVAARLGAIIRDKHDGSLTVRQLPQALIILNQGGALRPSDGRGGEVGRQELVEQALQCALESRQVYQSTNEAGEIVLTVPLPALPDSPEVTRLMLVERYEEDVLPYIGGRQYVDLRRWGEAV